MVSKTLFTSNSDEWATPQEVFDSLNAEFKFNLDACATSENHKTEKYFTQADDGLIQPWGGVESIVTRRIARLKTGLKKPITRVLSLIPLLSY